MGIEIIKIDDSNFEAVKTEQIVKRTPFDVNSILQKKKNIQSRKDQDNAARDLELAECDEIISKAKAGGVIIADDVNSDVV